MLHSRLKSKHHFSIGKIVYLLMPQPAQFEHVSNMLKYLFNPAILMEHHFKSLTVHFHHKTIREWCCSVKDSFEDEKDFTWDLSSSWEAYRSSWHKSCCVSLTTYDDGMMFFSKHCEFGQGTVYSILSLV